MKTFAIALAATIAAAPVANAAWFVSGKADCIPIEQFATNAGFPKPELIRNPDAFRILLNQLGFKLGPLQMITADDGSDAAFFEGTNSTGGKFFAAFFANQEECRKHH